MAGGLVKYVVEWIVFWERVSMVLSTDIRFHELGIGDKNVT